MKDERAFRKALKLMKGLDEEQVKDILKYFQDDEEVEEEVEDKKEVETEKGEIKEEPKTEKVEEQEGVKAEEPKVAEVSEEKPLEPKTEEVKPELPNETEIIKSQLEEYKKVNETLVNRLTNLETLINKVVEVKQDKGVGNEQPNPHTEHADYTAQEIAQRKAMGCE